LCSVLFCSLLFSSVLFCSFQVSNLTLKFVTAHTPWILWDTNKFSLDVDDYSCRFRVTSRSYSSRSLALGSRQRIGDSNSAKFDESRVVVRDGSRTPITRCILCNIYWHCACLDFELDYLSELALASWVGWIWQSTSTTWVDYIWNKFRLDTNWITSIGCKKSPDPPGLFP
jgi:hypothetical protein